MGTKILAVMENSIGPRLLLPTRLATLGYAVTVLSVPGEVRRRTGAETFDWLIVDEAVTRREGDRLLKELTRRQRTARIVWLGRPPSRARVPIEAIFPKPLDYDEIVRFFSTGASKGPVCSTDRPREGRAGCCAGGDVVGSLSPAGRRVGNRKRATERGRASPLMYAAAATTRETGQEEGEANGDQDT